MSDAPFEDEVLHALVWWFPRLGIAACLAILALAAGLLTWAGATAAGVSISLARMLEAGANCLPVALLFGLDQVRLRGVSLALRDVDLALLQADLCRRDSELRAGLRHLGAGEIDLR